MNTLLSLLPFFLLFVLLLYLSFTFFIFPGLIFFISPGFTEVKFSSRGGYRLVFSRPNHSCLQSSMQPPCDSDVATTCSIMSHFLNLNIISLSTGHKDALCAALAMLVSASNAPQSKVFIVESLAQTSSIFPTLDHALKSNREISSKLYALKGQKIEFE